MMNEQCRIQQLTKILLTSVILFTNATHCLRHYSSFYCFYLLKVHFYSYSKHLFGHAKSSFESVSVCIISALFVTFLISACDLHSTVLKKTAFSQDLVSISQTATASIPQTHAHLTLFMWAGSYTWIQFNVSHIPRYS